MATLAGRKIGRLAVVGNDAALAALALKACPLAGCELLLHRGGGGDGKICSEFNVEASLRTAEEVDIQCSSGSGPRPFNLLVPTSGTTGSPKWARHSLEALLSSARARTDSLEGCRFLMTFQTASFAGVQFLLSAMTAGGQLCCSTELNVPKIAELARNFPPHVISATPSFWRGFLLLLGKDADSLPLRSITLGGEIVDQAILDTLRAKFPRARIRHIYATTEVGSIAPVEDCIAGLPRDWLRRSDLGFGLRILDGELFVRGDRLMRGYEVSGQDTKSPRMDEYMRTGDLVEVVADRIVFKGRTDAMINVGGDKVNPEEVEQALLASFEVTDAFVYAHSNPLTGSVVAADVVLSPRTDAAAFPHRVKLMLRDKLPRHKIPHLIRVVESVQRSAAGKLTRSR